MRRQARSTAWAVSLFACLAATSSQAGDLIWEVESPFRFFKASRSFALHEAAFNAARGDPSAPLPADIVWRTERALNDPDCKDASTPDRCAATAGKRRTISKAGSAGPHRPWTRPATRATGVPVATRAFASANIPGGRRKKITSCRRRTRSPSGSHPGSSQAGRFTRPLRRMPSSPTTSCGTSGPSGPARCAARRAREQGAVAVARLACLATTRAAAWRPARRDRAA